MQFAEINFKKESNLADFGSFYWNDWESRLVYFFPDISVKILVLSSSDPQLSLALSELDDGGFIAADFEWKPDGKNQNISNPISVFQFCSSKLLLLLTNTEPNGSEILGEFLGSHKFFGKGTSCDKKKLKQMFGRNFDYFDIETQYLHPLGLPVSFTKLVKQFLGDPSAKFKDKLITISDWSIHPLTIQQILYAAFDAFAIYRIYPLIKDLPIPDKINTVPNSKQKNQSKSIKSKSSSPNKIKKVNAYDFTPKIPKNVAFASFEADLKPFFRYDPETINFERKEFSPRTSLFAHMKCRKFVSNLKCNICNLEFPNEDEIIEHSWMKHSEFIPETYYIEQIPLYWKLCVEQIDFALKNAIMTENGKLMTCSVCNDTYSSFHCFYQHCRMVHIFQPNDDIQLSLPNLLTRAFRLVKLVQGSKCYLCCTDMKTGEKFTPETAPVSENENVNQPTENDKRKSKSNDGKKGEDENEEKTQNEYEKDSQILEKENKNDKQILEAENSNEEKTENESDTQIFEKENINEETKEKEIIQSTETKTENENENEKKTECVNKKNHVKGEKLSEDVKKKRKKLRSEKKKAAKAQIIEQSREIGYREVDLAHEIDPENEELYQNHVWKYHGHNLQSLFKHRPIHYLDETYKESFKLGEFCMSHFNWGVMAWGNVACSFCRIGFDDPGELFVHLFHRHSQIKTVSAADLNKWPMPVRIFPQQLTFLIKGVCSELVIENLLQNNIYETIAHDDANDIQPNSGETNDKNEEGFGMKCKECGIEFRSKDETWKHALNCHLAIVFEQYKQIHKE